KYVAYDRCDPDSHVAAGIRFPCGRKLDPCASGHRFGGGNLPPADGQTCGFLTCAKEKELKARADAGLLLCRESRSMTWRNGAKSCRFEVPRRRSGKGEHMDYAGVGKEKLNRARETAEDLIDQASEMKERLGR